MAIANAQFRQRARLRQWSFPEAPYAMIWPERAQPRSVRFGGGASSMSRVMTRPAQKVISSCSGGRAISSSSCGRSLSNLRGNYLGTFALVGQYSGLATKAHGAAGPGVV